MKGTRIKGWRSPRQPAQKIVKKYQKVLTIVFEYGKITTREIKEDKTMTLNEMTAWVRAHNLEWQVRELVEAGHTEGQKEYIDAAIEYVYDAHTLSADEFRAKYIK